MKLELEINDVILHDSNFTEFDVKMILGAALLRAGVTSTGKTAQIIGIDYRTFYEEVGKYEEMNVEMTIEDIRRDCNNAKRI
jgi:predicted HTH domain antitoxin